MPPLPRIAILCSLSEHDGGAHSPRDVVVHAYTRCVLAAGGAPYLIPCISDPEAVARALEMAHGLLITGGADVDPVHYGQEPRRELGGISPERDALDRVVVAHALARPELPTLGICRGIQSMNVFAGGTLIQDIPSQVPGALKHGQQAPGSYATHQIEIAPRSALAETVGAEPLRVNSYHHQAVAEVAQGFRAVAHTADGVIEAIERDGGAYCVGVQFHPELMAETDERVARLFGRLVAEAGERA